MQRIRKNTLTILLALMLAFTGCFLSVGGSCAADDYHSWRQNDPRWGSTNMNGSTLASSGCLITSLAIMAMHSDSIDSTALKNLGISKKEDFNPGVLAKAYSARGAFTYGGGIASWGTISQIIPNITFVKDARFNSSDKKGIAAEITAMMKSGLHIIVNVNGHHWVYIEGVKGEDIYMIDPASDAVIVSDYYQIIGNCEYWALKCKNPPTVDFKAPVTHYDTMEYICSGSGSVYESEAASKQTDVLKEGYVFSVGKISGGCALIIQENNDGSQTEVGWVKTAAIEKTSAISSERGDINCDGTIDRYDLAILNEYLNDSTPAWARTLTSAELKAADMNGDGKVNGNDVISYLEVICTEE